jgi:bis(5'-nucleosidyl)-tetraphosphatase
MDLSSKMQHEHSAGAVLFGYFDNEEKEFLLLHYASGHWDFPKGNVEEGETETETVKREIYEETGISDVRFVKGFLEPIHYKYKRQGRLVHKKVSFYLAETRIRSVKLSHEHKDFRWAKYQAALTRLTYKSARDILVLANRFLPNDSKREISS